MGVLHFATAEVGAVGQIRSVLRPNAHPDIEFAPVERRVDRPGGRRVAVVPDARPANQAARVVVARRESPAVRRRSHERSELDLGIDDQRSGRVIGAIDDVAEDRSAVGFERFFAVTGNFVEVGGLGLVTERSRFSNQTPRRVLRPQRMQHPAILSQIRHHPPHRQRNRRRIGPRRHHPIVLRHIPRPPPRPHHQVHARPHLRIPHLAHRPYTSRPARRIVPLVKVVMRLADGLPEGHFSRRPADKAHLPDLRLQHRFSSHRSVRSHEVPTRPEHLRPPARGGHPQIRGTQPHPSGDVSGPLAFIGQKTRRRLVMRLHDARRPRSSHSHHDQTGAQRPPDESGPHHLRS